MQTNQCNENIILIANVCVCVCLLNYVVAKPGGWKTVKIIECLGRNVYYQLNNINVIFFFATYTEIHNVPTMKL